MSTLRTNAIVDAAGGNTVTINGITPTSTAGVLSTLNASGAAPVYACRAWVNFNGQGTVSIRASGNVSSITDNGVGDLTVNFTTPMQDANYAVIGQCSNSNNSAATVTETVQIHQNEPPAAGSVRIRTAAVTPSSAAVTDELFVFLAVFR